MTTHSKPLPSLDQLFHLERNARKSGTGVSIDSLTGDWKFQFVYKRGSDSKDLLASFSLKALQATLKIVKAKTLDEPFPLKIVNSIRFGPLALEFSGMACIKGLQPLLIFFFNKIAARYGESAFYQSSLKVPDESSRPFFSIIAIAPNRSWLAARGKGGGLAVWVKE